MVKRLSVALCLLTALGLATPAAAAPKGKGPKIAYGTSCIDGNANGACGDGADTPLAQALGTDGYYIDSQHGSHSGLVLQGGVSFPETLMVLVTHDVKVSGAITANGDNNGVSIYTLQGNITIAPKTAITTPTWLTFGTGATTSTIDIGANGTAKANGGHATLSFASAGTLHVGANQKYTSGGDIEFRGARGVQVDPGQSFTGGNHGSFSIDAGSDLDLTNVTWKAGYVLINAHGSAAHPGGRRLVIKNSTLHQTYRNGNMKIYADTPSLGRVLIDHSTLIARSADGGIVAPTATCIASTAPIWACT